jgi:type II secretory pathway predicted ATPase ExeA
MYLSHYKLNKKPFQISVDPNFLWMGEMHKEALAMLKYGILDNRGFIMLTGDVGTGKTTLVNALISSLGQDVIIANITNPGLKRIEFLNHLARSFGFGDNYKGKGQFLSDFQPFLEKCYENGNQVLLVIDEAQRISKDMFEEIRLLSNIEYQNVKLLNIFFVGQDELNDILGKYENRALRQRMTLQYHLKPLTEKEIEKFIQHRLKIAGTDENIFTKSAIHEIFSFSKGYPRLINIICDHAMLAGYVASRKSINAHDIKDCAEELRLPKKPDLHPQKGQNVQSTISIGSFYRYSPYIAGLLIFIFLIVLIYFPLRSGFSLFDVLSYWTEQINITRLSISKQTISSQTPQTTFKVKGEDNNIQGGSHSEKVEVSEALSLERMDALTPQKEASQTPGRVNIEHFNMETEISAGVSEKQKDVGEVNRRSEKPEDLIMSGLEFDDMANLFDDQSIRRPNFPASHRLFISTFRRSNRRPRRLVIRSYHSRCRETLYADI